MLRVLHFALSFAVISAFSFAQSAGPQAGVNPAASSLPAVSPAPVVGASAGPSSPASPASLIPENLLGEARAFYRQGNFPGAIASYDRYVKEHPESPDGYSGLVRVYLKQKDVEQAAHRVRESLEEEELLVR